MQIIFALGERIIVPAGAKVMSMCKFILRIACVGRASTVRTKKIL